MNDTELQWISAGPQINVDSYSDKEPIGEIDNESGMPHQTHNQNILRYIYRNANNFFADCVEFPVHD